MRQIIIEINADKEVCEECNFLRLSEEGMFCIVYSRLLRGAVRNIDRRDTYFRLDKCLAAEQGVVANCETKMGEE